MIAYKDNVRYDIWKIPSAQELYRYPNMQIPPAWVVIGERKGLITVSNIPRRWSSVKVLEESTNVSWLGIAGDWIVKTEDGKYSIYNNKSIEVNFRTPFGDDI